MPVHGLDERGVAKLAAQRRKLGDPTLIETVYGHGFRLADRPTADQAAGAD